VLQLLLLAQLVPLRVLLQGLALSPLLLLLLLLLEPPASCLARMLHCMLPQLPAQQCLTRRWQQPAR
jgi:hypothetical protein